MMMASFVALVEVIPLFHYLDIFISFEVRVRVPFLFNSEQFSSYSIIILLISTFIVLCYVLTDY
jgi:hypothetical protein